MNKMEKLFQDQRRSFLLSMVYSKQGLRSNIETMKHPLKEQNTPVQTYNKSKKNQDPVKNRSSDKKKPKWQDVGFCE